MALGATYNAAMKSVADGLRRAQRQQSLAQTAGERVALTARLAEADVELYCAAHQATPELARRTFARQRQAGRRFSRVARETKG